MNEQKWSDDALDLIKKRYLLGKDYSLQSWLSAVASHVCQHYELSDRENWHRRYYRMLESRKFLPTSAALLNSLNGKGSLAGCIVLPLPKSTREVIQKSIPEIAGVLFSGIGVGLDLSVLPPRLSTDVESGRANPGPVELICSITQAVEAPMNYGGVKRSAFMAALHMQHPDLFEFLVLKKNKRLSNVNISVTFDAAFSKALENKTLLPFQYDGRPVDKYSINEWEGQSNARHLPLPDLKILENGALYSRSAECKIGKVIKGYLYLDPEAALERIARMAHECGDPGLINLDAINKENPTHPRYATENVRGVGEIHVTTPCGEQPLLPYEVCHLGSINLAAFAFKRYFDFPAYQETIRTAVHFMDDLVDTGDNGLEQANLMSRANRKIGIGIMGLADTLAELEMPYDSEKARLFVQIIGKQLYEISKESSEKLAKERGAFPAWSQSKFAKDPKPRRHATLTTIAPTGHIATLAGCSTSIEPYFLVSYGRDAAGIRRQTSRVLIEKLQEVAYSLEEWIEHTQLKEPTYSFDGTLRGLSNQPTTNDALNKRLQDLKKVFKTAHEIHHKDHIAMVSVLQDYIENGISKTVNLPFTATCADVKEAFLSTIKGNLKGITVFRDKCLEEQALYAIEACPSCRQTHFLTPSECAGWKCDSIRGGCGWEVCAI